MDVAQKMQRGTLNPKILPGPTHNTRLPIQTEHGTDGPSEAPQSEPCSKFTWLRDSGEFMVYTCLHMFTLPHFSTFAAFVEDLANLLGISR